MLNEGHGATHRGAAHPLFLALLIASGFGLWLLTNRALPVTSQVQFGIAAITVCAIPRMNQFFSGQLHRLRNASPRARVFTAIGIAAASIAYIYFTSVRQGRSFQMVVHDEFMFRLQTLMLTRGRLWMPTHPLADFFEMFYVLSRPVYAPIYYPGAAMMYVPSAWLGLPAWTAPLLLSGIAIGLTYYIVCDLIDNAAGLLAAFLVLATPTFRRVSLLYMAQQPMLLLALILIVLWLRWRRKPALWNEIAIGVCAGWSAITRPIDAICFVAPIFIAMFVRELRTRPKRLILTLLICSASAFPFIALQLYFDHGVTGYWLRTPTDLCFERDMPGLNFGIHGNPEFPRPTTESAEKLLFYDAVIIPHIVGDAQNHRIASWYRSNGGQLPELTLPLAMLVILIPAGVLSRHRLAWMLAGPVALYLVFYPMYPFFIAHYAFVLIPVSAMLVVLGMDGVGQSMGRRSAFVSTALFMTVFAMGFGYLPEIFSVLRDQSPEIYVPLRRIESNLEKLPQVPSIVLFSFDPQRDNPHEEPVHNTESAWPDDQLFIRAHDLGSRNRELFTYYAARAPERRVYTCDRGDGEMRFIGTVAELAR